MWPIDAQRLRLVCSATSRAPSSTFSKSRLESPWPWVTMQKRCAPAASAARACSRICSGSIIACIGVSASAKRDCAQKPQSSAQPPDFALTSEHMSVESPKRSMRACQARSTSASISAGSSSSPSAQRFLAGDQGGHPAATSRGFVAAKRTCALGRLYAAVAACSGAAANTASKPSRQRGKRGAKPSSARAFALLLPRRSVLSSATALPATRRTTQAGRWRGGLAPASRATSGIQSPAAAGSSSVTL